MSDELARLLEVVEAQTGFDLRGYRADGLVRRAGQRARLQDGGDLRRYLDRVAGDTEEAGRLLDHLLVQVSGWFRDPHVWRVLVDRVLPGLAATSGQERVRAWVAGCGEGQEVYSLAACLSEVRVAGRVPTWSVLATDVDTSALHLLAGATYPPGPVPDGWDACIAPHVDVEDGRWQVQPTLTSRVHVGRHDVRDAPPEDAADPFDLVLCRNVLMYLDEDVQRRVLDGLLASVRPGGVLVLGQAELPIHRRDVLAPVDAGARVYRLLGAPLAPSRR